MMTNWARGASWAVVALAMAAGAAPALAQRASSVVASPRQSYDFSRDWRFTLEDKPGFSAPDASEEGWQAANLPHAFNETQAFGVDVHQLADGIVWYRKHFTLPAGAPKGRALLEFQGVRQAAQVWVNGAKVGESENGVMAFGVDATAALRAGDNVVAVRVDTHWDYREKATNAKFQWQDKNFYANYGGINKPVRLHLTGPAYQTLPLFSSLGTSGQYIWADGFDLAQGAATLHAETQVRNAGTAPVQLAYGVELRDADGRLVASFAGERQSLAPGATATLHAARRVAALHFWSWGYGYLYRVTSILRDGQGRVVDAVDTRTGFRATQFGAGVVRLNGRVLHLKGYAQRSTNEWPAMGQSVPPWLSDLSNGLMTGSNANLVRWMHVTPAKQEIESADRLGLIEAMPAGDSEGDVQDARWGQRLAVMRDAIIYSRNNPSILFYESGNKGITEAHMAQMRALRDQWDPHGGRAIGSREMLGSPTAEYGGEMLYINKSATKPLWQMEYSRDEAPRGWQDDFTPPFHKDAPDYNRNGESMAVEDVRRWWDYYEQRPGAGARSNAGGVKIGFTDSNSHFRGENTYRRSGVVDAMRLPKDAWYVHRALWDGWVEAEGHHLHIIGHWTYPAGTVKPVYVAANAQQVELFLNGRSLGLGRREAGFLFTFDAVAFAPGTLLARATFADGTTVDQRLTTAGPPVALRLVPHTGPAGLVADGSDVALVDVEVVDAAGQRVPTANTSVSFALQGAATWRGGIAQKGDTPEAKKASDNYVLATSLPVELGINRVALRATRAAGPVRLVARADGLAPAVVELASHPLAVVGGLSTRFAEDDQPGDLSRGATPAGDSVVPRLQNVAVVGYAAGANAQDAPNSHDDNEATTWTSDGKPENAWIEYQLSGDQPVSMLALRLTGWRLRSYPLRVLLDGKVVWQGETPRSLGYVNISFAPASGHALRIEQTGPTQDRDGFGQIVEVKDKRIAQSVGADAVPPGWRFSVVEADILGPLAKR